MCLRMALADCDCLLRTYYGPELTSRAVREWLERVGVKTLFIEPGSPWENGYVESLIGKLRDELLNGKIFYTLREAQVLVERWRQHYNRTWSHSSLGYRPPAPEARELGPSGSGSNITGGLQPGAGQTAGEG